MTLTRTLITFHKLPSLILLCCSIIIILFKASHAQYYEFNDVPVPDPKHILSVFRYFAYSPNDPPPLSVNGQPIGLSKFDFSAELKKRQLFLESNSFNSSHNNVSPSRILDPETSQTKAATEFQQPIDSSKENNKLTPDPATEIIFESLRFTGEKQDEFAHYSSIQLSILSYSDFWDVFYPISLDRTKRFCCQEEDVGDGKCFHKDQLIEFTDGATHRFKTVTVGQYPITLGQVKYKLEDTDMYLLLFSNCGYLSGGHISGKAYLRNYYGYLPGVEVPKVSFYLFLSSVYGGLILCWVILSLKHYTQLIHIHISIATVITLGILEGLSWFFFYRDWNSSLQRSAVLLAIAIVVTVVKNILSFMLVLVACLGWGVTRAALDKSTKQKIVLLIVTYIVFDSARQIMTQFRVSHDFSFVLIFSCLLPVSFLHGLIFFWIFTSLATLMEDLSARRQTEKLTLFSRFWVVLLITLVLAIVVLCAQVFVLSRESTNRWQSGWLFSELMPHLFFLTVLSAMMALWRPSRNSKTIAYSSEIPSDDPVSEMRDRHGSSASTRDTTVIGKGFGTSNDIYGTGEGVKERDISQMTTADDNNNNNINGYKSTGGKREMDGDKSYTEMSTARSESPRKVWDKTEPSIKDLDYDSD